LQPLAVAVVLTVADIGVKFPEPYQHVGSENPVVFPQRQSHFIVNVECAVNLIHRIERILGVVFRDTLKAHCFGDGFHRGILRQLSAQQKAPASRGHGGGESRVISKDVIQIEVGRLYIDFTNEFFAGVQRN